MSNYQIQLEKHIFKGDAEGPDLVIGARIHGDEPSGEIAIRKVIRELQDGNLQLARGRVILWPVLNPLAKDRNVRGVWGDTNRDITDRVAGSTPEDAIRRVIVQKLKNLASQAKRRQQSWHLLDLHSVPLPGKAHAILSEGPKDLAFARVLGVDTVYNGWRTAQLRIDAKDLEVLGKTRENHHDFTSALVYAARDAGAASSVCLESGQNDDPGSVQTAYQAIRNSLRFFRLTNETKFPFPTRTEIRQISFEQVLIRRDASEHLVDIFGDAQPVNQGQVVLEGASRQVCVPAEHGRWIVAHPIPNALPGRHIGFLAKVLG